MRYGAKVKLYLKDDSSSFRFMTKKIDKEQIIFTESYETNNQDDTFIVVPAATTKALKDTKDLIDEWVTTGRNMNILGSFIMTKIHKAN